MILVITVVHVVSCFFLIAVVLLQTGKGADMGAVFGGSSQTIFGSGGAGNLLTRLTTWTAVIFMVTSLSLTWWSTKALTVSIADEAPSEPPPLVAPGDEPLAPEAAAPPGEGVSAPAGDAAAPAPAGEAAPAAGAVADGVNTGAPVPAAEPQAAAPAPDAGAAPAAGTAATGSSPSDSPGAAKAENASPPAPKAAEQPAAP